jgi:photosystem II stability/assembly factor-like uncharacterized protein
MPPVTLQVSDSLANWQKIQTNLSAVNDIWFTSPAKGFLSTFSALYSSLDSGKTWSPVPGVTGYLVNLSFLNNTTGAMVGLQEIYITPDGTNWTKKNFPTHPVNGVNFQSDVRFSSTGTAWLATTTGFFRTTDTCNTWKKLNDAPVNGEFFFSDSEGIIYTADSNATTKPNIFLTSDSGNHWQPLCNIPGPNYASFNAIRFTDRQHGWISRNDKLFATVDGGNTWTEKVSAPPRLPALDVMFYGTQTGYLAQDTALLKTSNGGQTWTRICNTSPSRVSEFCLFDDKNIWVLCYDGTIFRLRQ